jgi:hypothetical protein
LQNTRIRKVYATGTALLADIVDKGLSHFMNCTLLRLPAGLVNIVVCGWSDAAGIVQLIAIGDPFGMQRSRSGLH